MPSLAASHTLAKEFPRLMAFRIPRPLGPVPVDMPTLIETRLELARAKGWPEDDSRILSRKSESGAKR